MLQLQLSRGNKASLYVTGNSMLPMLHHRKDTVGLMPVETPLRKGDLILYRRDSGKYVLHRIVRVREKGHFICSGDNQWEPETVFERQVIAVVTDFVRNGKPYTNRHTGYRFYVWTWIAIFPLRRPILWLRRKTGAVLRRIRRK